MKTKTHLHIQLRCLVGALSSVTFLYGTGTPLAAPRVHSPVTGQRNKGSISRSEAFDQVVKTVRDSFYDRELHGLDWKSVAARYREDIGQVRNDAEFRDRVNAMLAELKASHTEFFTQDDLGFWMLPAVMRQDMKGYAAEHIGVMGRRTADGYRVAAVLDGFPAAKAGIRAGDLLTNADGGALTEVGSFRGREGRQVSLRVRSEGAAEWHSVDVTPVRGNLVKAFLDATTNSVRIFNISGKRVGYVHLWTMAGEAFRSALSSVVLGRLHDTDGLVLDLRDGFGGRPFGYSDIFFNPDISWEQSERGRSSSQPTAYNGPMIVLINSGTRSAKEFLSLQFKKSRRATLVGQTTAGAFLGANSFPIGPDYLLELAVVGLKLDGKRVEGVGVSPDVEVAPSGTYTESDAQFAKACELLRTRLARPVL